MSDDRQIPTPAPADRPTFTILVDGEAISGEYQVQMIATRRSYNQVASADIRILDGDPATEEFIASDAPEFLPGNEVEILAGYHGDEESIFKGVIVRHGVRVYQDKPAVLRIECRDAAVALTVGRKSAYFYDVTDAEVIEEIAGGASLANDVEATDVTHPHMVQWNATDWDFILTRAEANGKLVVTKDGTLEVKAPDTSGDAALALSYGSTLLDFEAVIDARDQSVSLQSFAWDAANQELLEIDAADPAADSPGNLSPADLADVIGLDPHKLKHGGQLTDAELQAWADARALKEAFAKVRGRARIQGFAAIGPGDVLELGGLGDRFVGKALVSGVRHEIDTENWETDIGFGLTPEVFGAARHDIVDAPANGLLPGVGGLQLGLVTALEDPDGEDRVQVRIPMIDPSEEGVWARVASLDAGEERGAFFRPEIGDEVVIGFLNDDPRYPVLLGMLNSSAKPAPITASDDNHEKGFVTRSKLKIIFDDDKGTITVETPNENKIVLSDEDGGITLSDESGNTIVMSSDGIVIESQSDVKITASGDIVLEGTNISADASAEMKAEGGSGAKFASGGSTVVEGSVVQIN